jgi:hypothetical protein
MPDKDGTESNEDAQQLLSKQELLLHAHGIYRDEIIQQIRMVNRTNLRGVVAVAAIIGYAVSSGTEAVVGLVPVAMAYIFVKSAGSHMWIATQAKQVAEIEKELSDPDSPFRWEIRRGATVGKEYDTPAGMNDIKMLPGITRIILSAVGYFVAVVYTLNVAWPASPKHPLEIGITRQIAEAFYFILSISVLVIGVVYKLYVYKVGESFEAGSGSES